DTVDLDDEERACWPFRGPPRGEHGLEPVVIDDSLSPLLVPRPPQCRDDWNVVILRHSHLDPHTLRFTTADGSATSCPVAGQRGLPARRVPRRAPHARTGAPPRDPHVHGRP